MDATPASKTCGTVLPSQVLLLIVTTFKLFCRFGEAGLLPCEVMLKDLADSKRLDANVRALPQQQQQQQALPEGVAAALSRLRATICSYLFWPELPEHELQLPADLQTALDVSGPCMLAAAAAQVTCSSIGLEAAAGIKQQCSF